MKKFWFLVVVFDILAMIGLGFTGLLTNPWLFDLAWMGLGAVGIAISLFLTKQYSLEKLVVYSIINFLVLFVLATMMLDLSILAWTYWGLDFTLKPLILFVANAISFGWLFSLLAKK